MHSFPTTSVTCSGVGTPIPSGPTNDLKVWQFFFIINKKSPVDSEIGHSPQRRASTLQCVSNSKAVLHSHEWQWRTLPDATDLAATSAACLPALSSCSKSITALVLMNLARDLAPSGSLSRYWERLSHKNNWYPPTPHCDHLVDGDPIIQSSWSVKLSPRSIQTVALHMEPRGAGG